MLIRVSDLQLQKLEFNQDFVPGAVDFGPDFRQVGSLHTKGRAELIVEHRGHKENVDDIRVVGGLDVTLEVACARCLETLSHTVNWTFDLLYRPLGVDRRAEEVAITEADTEIGYYEDKMRDYSLRNDLGARAWDVFCTANFLNFMPWTAAIEHLLQAGPANRKSCV